ncbi:MAG: PLP-dependent aminotransferase family protein [Rhodospirillales bacterium]
MWIPDITKLEGPRYLAVAIAIAKAIDGGELPPGAQLPPQRDLAVKLGVTVGTISRAYTLAKKRKLVSGEVGRGTFVSGARDASNAASVIPQMDARAVDLACYRTPVADLAETIAKSLSEMSERADLLPLHRYPPAAGFLSHRAAGAAWIGRSGMEVSPDSVLICNGAQQGLSLALAALASPGEKLLTETVTYSGLKALAALNNIELCGVAMDEQGIIPEALEQMLEVVEARLIYLQPTVHNPTTAFMDAERRRKIADIIRRHDLTLIEDDAGCTALTDRPLPIASLVPDRSVYITSVSKCLSPALRIGYLAAPTHILEMIQSVFHANVLGASPLMAELVSQMISSGAAHEIAQRNLEESGRLNRAALRLLKGHDVRSHPACFYLWLMLPKQWSAEEFAAAARADGVSVVPADNFLASREASAHGVRVSLNPSFNPDVLHKGLDVLNRLLNTAPRLRETVI